MTTLADLTAAQRRALPLLKLGVQWTPGEGPRVGSGNKVVRRDVIARLEKAGIAMVYGLHPYGPMPVYGAALDESGEAIVAKAREDFRQLATSVAQGAPSLPPRAWLDGLSGRARYEVEAIGYEAALVIASDVWAVVSASRSSGVGQVEDA